jgi:hypothetical protein
MALLAEVHRRPLQPVNTGVESLQKTTIMSSTTNTTTRNARELMRCGKRTQTEYSNTIRHDVQHACFGVQEHNTSSVVAEGHPLVVDEPDCWFGHFAAIPPANCNRAIDYTPHPSPLSKLLLLLIVSSNQMSLLGWPAILSRTVCILSYQLSTEFRNCRLQPCMQYLPQNDASSTCINLSACALSRVLQCHRAFLTLEFENI